MVPGYTVVGQDGCCHGGVDEVCHSMVQHHAYGMPHPTTMTAPSLTHYTVARITSTIHLRG